MNPTFHADRSLLALTRAVSAAIGRCALTHIPRAPIDLAAARAEHVAYEQVVINAVSGEVQGTRPWSFWRIFFAALGGAGVIGAVVLIFQANQ